MPNTDLELGPCQALWGTAGAEADLGETEGGVRIKAVEATVISGPNGTPEELNCRATMSVSLSVSQAATKPSAVTSTLG